MQVLWIKKLQALECVLTPIRMMFQNQLTLVSEMDVLRPGAQVRVLEFQHPNAQTKIDHILHARLAQAQSVRQSLDRAKLWDSCENMDRSIIGIRIKALTVFF